MDDFTTLRIRGTISRITVISLFRCSSSRISSVSTSSLLPFDSNVDGLFFARLWRFIVVALLLRGASSGEAAEALTRVPIDNGMGALTLSADAEPYFLEFGQHRYAPDEIIAPSGKKLSEHLSWSDPVVIAPFQGLRARKLVMPKETVGQRVDVTKSRNRDSFWDQVILVSPAVVATAPEYDVVEVGEFGEALPGGTKRYHKSAAQIGHERESLTDPHITSDVNRELAWAELEANAFPLDFQKVLIGSPNDSSPGFAYQNGQWFTTWLSRDLPQWTKEDHWFAPALLVGRKLVRPAPLAAKSEFTKTGEGVTLPRWSLEWQYQNCSIRQTLFSWPAANGSPHVFIELSASHLPSDAKLALGVGRRPNAHYWDDKKRERTPIPFFTLTPGYRQRGKQLVDRWNRVVLESAQEFRLEQLGPFEMLLTFAPDDQGNVHLRAPQSDAADSSPAFFAHDFDAALRGFEQFWRHELRQGAHVALPSKEWMERIDIWRSQVASITRVKYDGQERLSYGAYFYQAYFGPEEGWPIVALAQWGRKDESQRQTNIMLSAENRRKDNVHHQSRNGVFGWYAAEVARLTNDRTWLESIAPALIENAEWTINARETTNKSGNSVTRGLLPPHIYGGDIRDAATSLYASAVCCKGLAETADVFQRLGSPSLVERGRRYETEARQMNARLSDVISQVTDRNIQPPFLPLALALPSLGGQNEGPYERLTDTRLGNYWNLFAPSVLELGLVVDGTPHWPNAGLLDYMGTHGGLWSGLPRFHTGLDAAYSIGVINELLRESVRDVRQRNRALASLQSFFLHAASRNGYSIPEVASLFPDRLDASSYERLVREAPWSFGMYSADEYIDGHISFTEPLGAAAGEALWMIRNALVCETRDARGELDSGLFVLSTVPGDWFDEGREIELDDFPTYYGTLSLQTTSRIRSRGEIEMKYRFTPNEVSMPKTLTVRLAPTGFAPRDIRIAPDASGIVRETFVK